MAKEKKSFILYSDLIYTVKKLIESDRKNNTNDSGELFYHILQYVNDISTKPINMVVDLTFEPIKQSLIRDLSKWERVKSKKSEGGRLGNLSKYYPDLFKAVSDGKISLKKGWELFNERKSNSSKKTSHSDKKASHSDKKAPHTVASIAVSVNDNVNANVSTTDVVDFNNKIIETLKKDEKWLNEVLKRNKISAGRIMEKLDDFNSFLNATLKIHESKEKLAAHFVNWLPKNLKQDGSTESTINRQTAETINKNSTGW